MAEITNSETNAKSNKRKFIRVDMTPMVDLGFLLITFFMFTTNFSKPNVMDLGLPAGEEGTEIDYRNQIAFILGKNNTVFYYQKDTKDLQNSDIKETNLEGLEIAKIANAYKAKAPKPEIFTIIIKPNDESLYKNFVDIIDELAISKNDRYGIAEIKESEKQIIEKRYP